MLNLHTLHTTSFHVDAKHVDTEPEWVWTLAKQAWNESRYKDITNGATHWENVRIYGKPSWASKMKEVYRYKDHVFYKED